MKIIHCSDLHLDSKMETHLSRKQAQDRNTEICGTFSALVDYAKAQEVSLVLIAGDLFDSQRIRSTTVSFVLDVIAQAPDIDFLYLKGNHDENADPLSGIDLPKNLKLFSDQWTCYSYDNVTVTGVELTGENCLSIYDSLALDSQNTNIVMLHGQESTQPGKDLICLPRLKGRHIHYLALGHLHSYQENPLDHSGRYCYCGCLEGRGFDECGPKGFVLLEVSDRKIRSEFIPFAKRTLHEIPVDITGKDTIGQLRGALSLAAADIPATDLVKFTLRGSYTMETQKDIPFLTQLLKEQFYFVRIKDESKLAIEKESYENDASLKGEFIRTVMNAPLPEEDKEKIIRAGLLALAGEDVTL